MDGLKSFHALLEKLVLTVDEFSEDTVDVAPSVGNKVSELRIYLVALVKQNDVTIQSQHHVELARARQPARSDSPSRLNSDSERGRDKEITEPPIVTLPAESIHNRPSTQHRLSEPLTVFPVPKKGSCNRHSEPPPLTSARQSYRQVHRNKSPTPQGPESRVSDAHPGVDAALDRLQESIDLDRSSEGGPRSLDQDTSNIHKISHEIENGVVTFHPSRRQWPCFDKVLQQVKLLGAETVGVFKISLQHLDLPAKLPIPNNSARSYKTQLRKDGTVNISTSEDAFVPITTDPGTEELSTDQAVARLEQDLRSAEPLKDSRYFTDLPARNFEDRVRFDLPVSPIWPVLSNKLDQTRFRVPGIHWPYAYRANATIGAIFALHIEDFALYSLNVLYKGSKVWHIVPPAAKDQLESKVWTKRSRPQCAQFIREKSLYIPTTVLKEWNIPYRTVRQRQGDILVTFPDAYHQGFSIGETLAEAVNYADNSWDPEQYTACTARTCPIAFIGQEMMKIREDGEQQMSAGEESDAESTSSLIEMENTILSKPRLPKQAIRSKVVKARTSPKAQTQKWPAKRKAPSTSPEPPAKKSTMIKQLSENFCSVLSMPEKSPIEIYNEFYGLDTGSDGRFDETRCTLLTRLFFAIGSPDAVCQLRDAYRAMKSSDTHISLSTKSIADSVRALDNLDNTVHLYAILRRFHLMALCRHRDDLLSEIRVTRGRNLEEAGRAESLAQKRLMSSAYPNLAPPKEKRPHGRDEYTRKSKALTYRIMVGQRWSRLSRAFAPGILALLPTRGDFQLSNSDFEKLPTAAIDMLINMLKRYRGEFLQEVSSCMDSFDSSNAELPLVYEDPDNLRQQEYDSPRLVELCRGETVVSD